MKIKTQIDLIEKIEKVLARKNHNGKTTLEYDGFKVYIVKPKSSAERSRLWRKKNK